MWDISTLLVSRNFVVICFFTIYCRKYRALEIIYFEVAIICSIIKIDEFFKILTRKDLLGNLNKCFFLLYKKLFVYAIKINEFR